VPKSITGLAFGELGETTMAESARILIPDISGYTEFLTKTELVHSSHIINELLEAILAAGDGEFELSEVEGDALLLYRKGKPVDADGLVGLCLRMFESFHTQVSSASASEERSCSSMPSGCRAPSRREK
jgi:hypothetical protein